MKMYEIGGCVRDEILGIPSKDIDFTFVYDVDDLTLFERTVENIDPFEFMVEWLTNLGFKIHVEHPEHLTVRAQFPRGQEIRGIRDADFVLARKEGEYTDGRRPDVVEPGTLEDDILRRDFTVNALAKDSEGNIIDMVGGVQDINDRVLRAVGSAYERLTEDALRALRALRFSVTKGFRIDHELRFAMQNACVIDSIKNNISDERIKEELHKMFAFDTLASMRALRDFPVLTEAIFSGSVWLDASMKTRK